MSHPKVEILHLDKLFIDGEWVRPQSGSSFAVIDAATEEVIAEVAEANEVDVDRAVAAAREAFDTGPWPQLSYTERAEFLKGAAAGLRARSDEIGHLWTRQVGVLRTMSSYLAEASARHFDVAAALAGDFPFEQSFDATGGGTGQLLREPVGVVGAILPWNSPLQLAATKVAPALLAGCTVIVKASPEACLELYILAEIFEALNLPKGVFNLVTADREASERLVVNPDVDKISFTGSSLAGRRIGALCGARVARCTLELGGKSPAIVLEDADVDAAAQVLAEGCMRMSGQICAALTRVIVVEERHDELVEALKVRFLAASAGDPYDAMSSLGPVATAQQRDRVEGYIKKGLDEGAVIAARGAQPDGPGYYVAPTLFVDVDNRSTIAQEEIFGPVLSVIRAADEADAIRLANDTSFGLNASVFTAEKSRADAVGRKIRSGTIGWNRFGVDFAGAFGGYKQSGIGREGGREGLLSYLETKSMLI